MRTPEAALQFTCPFCPLRCDDVVVEVDEAQVSAARQNCQRVSKGLAQVSTATAQAICNGLTATTDPAAVQVASSLARLASIAISGTIDDIETARAAVRFASAVGGVVDCCETMAEAAMRRVVEREGIVAATLAELRCRADSVVLLGDPTHCCPRLLERFLDAGPQDLNQQRRFMSFGSAAIDDLQSERYIHVRAEPHTLHKQLARLRLELRGGNKKPGPVAAWFGEASYMAWLWSPDVVNHLVATALVGLISDLNAQRRAVAISLASDVTFRSVAAWLTGTPGPVDFGGGDRSRGSTTATELAPAVVWLQPYPGAPAPPRTDGQLIVIGLPDAETAARADLCFAAGVPGIDAVGTTIRGDGVVSLPLRQVRNLPLPSASEVLSDFASQIVAQRLSVC